MRIFLKVFFGFWLALAGVAIASLSVTVLLGDNTLVARWLALSSQAVGIYAQTAADTYEQGGRSSLDKFLLRVDNTSHIQAFLFDDHGDELSSRPAPAVAVRDAVDWRRRDDLLFLVRPMRAWSTTLCIGPSGRRYVLVCNLNRLTPPVSAPALRVLAVILVASLVCFLLAKNVADPILMLRRATSDLADGKFSSRVDAVVVCRADEIGDLGRDFDIMAARLESSVNAQNRLLADISHELRSPLARLSVAAGLAARSSDPATLKVVERIELEAGRLNTLIGQLSLLSTMESNVLVPKFHKLSLSEIIKDVAADAQFEASSQSKSVTLQLQSEDDILVNGDEELLRSAFDNIVRNAVRYTPENSSVEISLCVKTKINVSSAVIIIRDHGIGIDEAHIEKVFQPFYRVDDARDRTSGGVGLGLAIADHTVRLHNGVITASNSKSGGLEVEIQLPVDA